MRCFLLSVFALIPAVGSLLAQPCWGRPARASVDAPQRALAENDALLEWKEGANDDELSLWRGNVQVGGYSVSRKLYLPIVAGRWGRACDPPIAVPEPEARLVGQTALPTGVEWDKIGKGEKYHCSGKVCTKAEAYDLLKKDAGGKQLPDDIKKFRLTLIGPVEARAKVEQDLALPENADIREATLLWSVPPDHWSVADVGFVTTGSPTVYLQAPGGKDQLRVDSAPGAPLFGEIRRRIAGYDPKKDPGLSSDQPYWLLAVGGAVLLAGLAHKKKAPQ